MSARSPHGRVSVTPAACVAGLLHGLLLPAAVGGQAAGDERLHAEHLAQHQGAGEAVVPGHGVPQRRQVVRPHGAHAQQVLPHQPGRHRTVLTEVHVICFCKTFYLYI